MTQTGSIYDSYKEPAPEWAGYARCASLQRWTYVVRQACSAMILISGSCTMTKQHLEGAAGDAITIPDRGFDGDSPRLTNW